MRTKRIERLVADLEIIRKQHEEEAGDGNGCYGLGRESMCPCCSALMRFKEATAKDEGAIKLNEARMDKRTRGTLMRHGIETLNDLEDVTRYEVATMRNIGREGLKNVLKVMAEHGKALKGEAVGA